MRPKRVARGCFRTSNDVTDARATRPLMPATGCGFHQFHGFVARHSARESPGEMLSWLRARRSFSFGLSTNREPRQYVVHSSTRLCEPGHVVGHYEKKIRSHEHGMRFKDGLLDIG